MNRLRIGIRLESLALPLRKGLQEVERLGVSGIQVDAAGDLAPAALGQTGRREFRHLLRSYNLELTALGCPLRRGLDVAERQDERIDHVKKVMSLSFDLGPRVVVVQAGGVPDDAKHTAGTLLTEALLALAQYGDRVGVRLALETGLESGETFAQFLKGFDTGALGVNCDPANLLMHDFDPVASTRALAGRILHVHAKDARKSSASRSAQEVPLGHGDIDWMEYLGVLEEVEYRGWLTIERESGSNRLADVGAGIALLRRLGV
jgi:sugar phosphate isomerase/epimerase